MPKMQHTLTSLLFPEYRRRVLALLLLRPEEALHGRELARRTGLSAGTLTRELNLLAEQRTIVKINARSGVRIPHRGPARLPVLGCRCQAWRESARRDCARCVC